MEEILKIARIYLATSDNLNSGIHTPHAIFRFLRKLTRYETLCLINSELVFDICRDCVSMFISGAWVF
jgi:hypothetical protein